jgi:hypothetical protein
MSMNKQRQLKLGKMLCNHCKKKLREMKTYYALSSWFKCSCSEWRYDVKADTWLRYSSGTTDGIIDNPKIYSPFIFR